MMKDNRYQNDNSRPGIQFTWPTCCKKDLFTRYIDTQTRNYLPEYYGTCDRANRLFLFSKATSYKDVYSKKVWESEAKN